MIKFRHLNHGSLKLKFNCINIESLGIWGGCVAYQVLRTSELLSEGMLEPCHDLWSKQLSCGAWTQPSLWFVTSFLPPSIFLKFISLQSFSYVIWVDFLLFCFHLLFDFIWLLLLLLLLLLVVVVAVMYLICIVISLLSTFLLYMPYYFLQHFV